MADVLGRRTAFENAFVRLQEDRLRLPDGLEIDYVYVTRPRYALVAAVEDGRIWLVEQYRHPLGGRTLELPMGIAENAATIEEAAATELREETGLRAERLDYVAEIAPAPALLAQTGALFLATGLSRGARALEATEQDLTAAPWPIEDAVAAMLDGRIRDGATLAALGLLRLKELI